MTVLQESPLGAGLRRIRRVGPPEVPVRATRAMFETSSDDEEARSVLLVDAHPTAGWDAWGATGTLHLFAPIDVFRTEDGHEALFPDLGESCAHACGVRESQGSGWHRGEVVTLVVSLLRGVAEAAERALLDGAGEWWLTLDRRPVFAFAHDDGEGSAIAPAAGALARRIAAACEDRVVSRAVDEAVASLERPAAIARHLDRLEHALFEAAAPQPIDRDGAAVRRGPPREPRVIVNDDDAHEARGVVARIAAALEGLIDERLSGLVRAAIGRLRGRGRLLLAAGIAVAAVVAGAALWPSGDGAPRAAVGAGAIDRDAPRPTRDPDGPGTAVDGEDPVGAARALLAGGCGDPCGISTIAWEGAVASADATVELVDNYGAVALLAVRAPNEERQLLVMERTDGGWRIREVTRAPGE